MGDRGNVFFVDRIQGKKFEGIYMYAHWDGADLPAIVRAALKRGEDRWGDSQYLARIVFCQLIKDSVLEDTGYGLSTEICDNEYPIIRVDDLKERVSYHTSGKERSTSDKGLASWSYAEFVKAKDAALNAAFGSETDEDDDDDDDDDGDDTPAPTKKKPAKKASLPKAKAKLGMSTKATASPKGGKGGKAIGATGKKFLFTGKLATMSRDEAKQRVTAVGGISAGSVSKDLDYLVIGDEGSPLFGAGSKGDKMLAAEKLIANGAKLKIISEKAFLAMKGTAKT